MTTEQFQRYYDLTKKDVTKDLRIDLILAALAIAGGVILTVWIGPEAGVLGGALSAIMFGRYYVNKNKLPYFIEGTVLRKWEEKRMWNNKEEYFFYAELTEVKSIQKNKKAEIEEKVLETNFSAEIFNRGYSKLSEGDHVVLCFTAAGIYTGFISKGEYVSYWEV